MTTPHHDPEEEVIMAYLDGELAGHEADQVERHLADCAACAGVADGLRQTSAALTRWDTGPVPAFTPKVRAIGVDWWRRVPKHYVALAAAAVLVLAVGAEVILRPMPASVMAGEGGGPAAATAPLAEASVAEKSYPDRLPKSEMLQPATPVRSLAQTREIPGGPLLVRTARMMITAADFDTARARFEAIVSGAGGFMGNVSVSAATREQRTLSATVRVPGPALEKTLAALRTIGTVTSEALDAEDVTQQSVDLDARLVNARASESRLKMILEQRTGRLSDVLDVEREISRVRGEIERMEAQRKDLDRRIQYASISVTISEEQRASLDLGPQPLSTRFRNAFVEGWTAVFSGAIDAGLLLTGLLPTIVVLSLLGAPVVVLYRRRARLARSASR
jgi:hypothetical protein